MQDYLATTTLGDLARKSAGISATPSSEATSASKESLIRQNIGEMNQ
jgi:hypothetical protein